MGEYKEWRSGSYPTLYTCQSCRSIVKQKEIVAGRARQLNATTCVCAKCLQSHQGSPREEKAESQPQASIQATTDQRKALELEPAFVEIISAARSDPFIRRQVLMLAHLDDFNRSSAINTLIDEMRLKGTSPDLLRGFALLRERDIALRTIEILSQ